MIWSCLNSKGLSRSHICEGSISSERYKSNLDKFLIPTINDLGINYPTLLDGSIRPHRTQIIKNWLSDNNIGSFDLSGKLPKHQSNQKSLGYFEELTEKKTNIFQVKIN